MKQQERKPPVNEGDIVQVTVGAIGDKGDGICRYKGYIIFVPNVSEGDVIKVKVTKTLPKVGFGEVTEKLGATKPLTVENPKDSEEFGEELESPEEDTDDYDMSMPGLDPKEESRETEEETEEKEE